NSCISFALFKVSKLVEKRIYKQKFALQVVKVINVLKYYDNEQTQQLHGDLEASGFKRKNP
ncbi:1893_t:CDS:2, partial [Funneliformis mosseae]